MTMMRLPSSWRRSLSANDLKTCRIARAEGWVADISLCARVKTLPLAYSFSFFFVSINSIL